MPFQFGTIFSQAMQNAIAAEQQKKKDVMDYNMNVDKLNLDKWSSYNNLNLDAQRLNEEGKRWAEEMRLKVDDTNWTRQFETQKWNTGLDLEKAKNFITPTEQWQKNHFNTYGTPWSGVTAPGTGGMVSINAYGEIDRPMGETFFKATQADLDRGLQREQMRSTEAIAAAGRETQKYIAKLQIDADRELRAAGDLEQRNIVTRNLNTKAQQTELVKVDNKGNITQRYVPKNWNELIYYQQNGWHTAENWKAYGEPTLNGIKDPNKKTSFPGSSDGSGSAADNQGFYK